MRAARRAVGSSARRGRHGGAVDDRPAEGIAAVAPGHACCSGQRGHPARLLRLPGRQHREAHVDFELCARVEASFADVGRVDALLRRHVIHRARQRAQVPGAVRAVADDRLADEDLDVLGQGWLDVARPLHTGSRPPSRRSRGRRPAPACAAAREPGSACLECWWARQPAWGSAWRARRPRARWPTGGRRASRRARAARPGPGKPGRGPRRLPRATCDAPRCAARRSGRAGWATGTVGARRRR